MIVCSECFSDVMCDYLFSPLAWQSRVVGICEPVSCVMLVLIFEVLFPLFVGEWKEAFWCVRVVVLVEGVSCWCMAEAREYLHSTSSDMFKYILQQKI